MCSIQSIPSLAAFPKMATNSPSFSKFSMASTLVHSDSKEARDLKKVSYANSMAPEKAELFKSIEGWARDNILPLLKPVEKSWQPGDLLPDSASEGFFEQVKELRERAKELPDDYLVAIVGNMITEEALPMYQSRVSTADVYRDETGRDETPWAIWSRGWSSEENRHGDLLNKYLYLSGRVDIQQVERTIHYMISSGTNFGFGDNPYHFTVYTSIQERGTGIAHGNTAKLALKHGDSKLAQVCGTIAADEKRHETAYSRIVGKLFELDPNEAMVAFADMLKMRIIMPGDSMYDGQDENLFNHATNVWMRTGVYTITDYINILKHFRSLWNIGKLEGLKSDGKFAQDYICGLPERVGKMEERAMARAKQAPAVPISWIFNREV
ncbi:stearoyl-[acyl-carrier-protein] 9-desaturase, chloroplastic-like isoform X1 [Mangifera indica]|uniref:stearoyl-[acyl-carrier-protein] 9-desaturase, chloroplastic-like isoform X1 n=2 Tax=Mangifera indica TaxID=29780 RepID=UPI001CF97E3D|nr:stearoyl-[acyl-carrier-protein] 9-desaturase, chloroplastic-like isoform X1 [Mangifera indica]